MRISALLFFSLFSLNSCLFDTGKDEIILAQAKPSRGFNYPYFLFIPDGAPVEMELVLIVEPNNSGFADDNLKKHIEKARRIASRDFYIGNFVARELNYPLLVPVFPRSKSEWRVYTHAFDRDVALQKNNSLQRIDLQLLNMIDDAEATLREKGYRIRKQILMTGFSASGSFVNRFTAVHPEKIMAVAAGGVNGLLILPVDTLNEKPLNFPLGTNDFPDLFGQLFDYNSFINTPQYYYMGELDSNDAIPYEDGYDPDERNLVFELLGEEMQPARWENCIKIYKVNNIKARFKTYNEIGHENPIEIKEDVLNFFKENLH